VRTHAVVVLLMGCAAAACAQAHPTTVRVPEAWVRVQGDITGMSAGYLTIQNTGTSPVVVRGVACRGIQMVTMHETVITNGMARMVSRDSLVVPAGDQVVMRPGGLHLMLMGLAQPLSVGQHEGCTVRTSAGEVLVTAAVRAS
jgi:copper(I)-binding protein